MKMNNQKSRNLAALSTASILLKKVYDKLRVTSSDHTSDSSKETIVTSLLRNKIGDNNNV